MAGENYIGSKISLISLSDIRYVGILHSINANDSTVGLKQVRSFGTEGRRERPEEEILPSDNVFDYVVFRGSDIKDLQVFEAPPKPTPPPQPVMPQDPAIMSMSNYPPVNPYMNNNMYMQPPQQQQQQYQHQQQQQQQQPLGRAQAPGLNNNANQGTTYWQPTFPSEPEVIHTQQQQLQVEKDPLDELKAELEETDALQPTINEAAIEQLAKKVSELNPSSEDKVIKSLDEEQQPIQQQQQQKQQQDQPPQQQQQNRRRYDNYRNNNNNHRNNNGGRYNNNNNKNRANFTIPSSEFDFEASNAKFDKSEIIKKEVEEDKEDEIEIPPADEFYDKTSSFFDNISCESKERSEQQQQSPNEMRRHRFQEERKLNLETFGQASVDQSRYRNYRGRGGNNNYRGNRNNNGYYRNNNRNNNNYNRQQQQQQQIKPQQQQQQPQDN
ncbi:MAG: Scd6-like Sm domain-containing protein [Benjaminiella poitrasii]|nr:MAG: Scd6-like Sm domain-containing protein [Benjaminiella poitrasii]